MTTFTVFAATGVLLASLTACGGGLAQDLPSPTPAVDPFDPAVVEATPIPGLETFQVTSADHTTAPVDYPQVPPVGGPHDPAWQKCAFYEEPVRAENAVHALEHGAVWITYQRDLPQAEREALATLAAGKPFLLISPFPGLEDPVVASAWGAQLRLEEVGDPRLQAFITRYAGNGPERGARCGTGIETTG